MHDDALGQSRKRHVSAVEGRQPGANSTTGKAYRIQSVVPVAVVLAEATAAVAAAAAPAAAATAATTAAHHKFRLQKPQWQPQIAATSEQC